MNSPNYSLPFWGKCLLFFLSFCIVAFGQPLWGQWLGLISAFVGFSLFWRLLLAYPEKNKRFFLGFFWFALVGGVQLSWFLSHPYLYIIGVHLFCSLLMGTQFGVLSLLITPSFITSWSGRFLIASLWTLFEWSRLFILSGLSWNPVGMALAGNLYSLQMAALWGVFGLSFWVIFLNLLSLNLFLTPRRKSVQAAFVFTALFPFVFGYFHLSFHAKGLEDNVKTLDVLLVQPAFPAEEAAAFESRGWQMAFAFDEWKRLVKLLRPMWKENMDLILLPEYVISYGTYAFIYPQEASEKLFREQFGEVALSQLPPAKLPLAMPIATADGEHLFVNNAYFAQALANLFDADLILGLGDADRVGPEEFVSYSSALRFHPLEEEGLENDYLTLGLQRYEKRVLVPMGEYIPFAFCREIAAKYGVTGSFTPGESAKLFSGKHCQLGVSICYEETYGDLMRESRLLGAEALLNLTSDVWFPNSTLPKQHFDHARLRTVENGIPLVRACNTGVTAVIDSVGQTVAQLGDDSKESEWVAGTLKVSVPLYTYATLYSYVGDGWVVGVSLLVVLLYLASIRK